MRRFSKLLIVAALLAALILPVAAATTDVTYNIAGVASVANFQQTSFAGAAVSASKHEVGVWKAVVGQDLGGITGGTFTFRSKVRTFEGTLAGGTFAPIAGGTCTRRTFAVHGLLSGGVLDVTLTQFGMMRSGACVVYLATVRGIATLAFPS